MRRLKALLMHDTCLQVSHHPPVGAAHGEHQDWQYDMVSAPTTKFLGNSVDIFPIGGQPSCLNTVLLRRLCIGSGATAVIWCSPTYEFVTYEIVAALAVQGCTLLPQTPLTALTTSR